MGAGMADLNLLPADILDAARADIAAMAPREEFDMLRVQRLPDGGGGQRHQLARADQSFRGALAPPRRQAETVTADQLRAQHDAQLVVDPDTSLFPEDLILRPSTGQIYRVIGGAPSTSPLVRLYLLAALDADTYRDLPTGIAGLAGGG